jgi:8-oxo-dGTP pyrophosphatase MutT (NUDIX family)
MVKQGFPEEMYLAFDAGDLKCSIEGDFVLEGRAGVEQAIVWEGFRQSRPNAFDGKLLRLRSFSFTESRANLVAQVTSFSAYITSRDPIFLERFPESERADPLGLTVLLLGSDNRLILTQRSLNAEQNPGGLYFIGGYAEPNEFAGDLDIFDEACREVVEEIGLAQSEINERALIGLAYDPVYCHPEMFFLVRANADAEAIIAASSSAVDRHEANRIFSAPFEKLLDDSFDGGRVHPRTWSFEKGIKFARHYVKTTGGL